MSFSTAFQSLRHSAARSVTHGQVSRLASSSRAAHRGGVDDSASQQWHAPHGNIASGDAGPSRCFCSSHRTAKASELPLEELRYESSLDTYHHDQPQTAAGFWHPSDASRPRSHPKRQSQASKDHTLEPSPSIRALFDHRNRPLLIETSPPDFFTSSKPKKARLDYVQNKQPPIVDLKLARPAPPPTYIASLQPHHREAFESRVRLLIRSGERSMSVLSAEFGDVTASEREQICCHILSQCVKESPDARLVWDIYRSWKPTELTDKPDGGPTRSTVRRMQEDTLYKCVTYLQTAGLTRQAATVVGDGRLRPSQSRFLLERLIFDLKLPSRMTAEQPSSDSTQGPSSSLTSVKLLQQQSTSSTAVDVRLAVREMGDAMISLTADGVSFKRRVVNRMFKLLCLTKAGNRIVRLLRTAQRRAQIEASTSKAGNELRTAGGFSRLRAEEVKPPQVISTKVMEESLFLLCTQDLVGARTAFELLNALDATQRTSTMYDTLMGVFANALCLPAPASSPASNELSVGYQSTDEQLWHDICTLPHLGGPTLRTMSARIVCHARNRRLDLIKSDLDFVRTTALGTIHDLTETARLSIVRCCIERGSLLTGFRYTSVLLGNAREDKRLQSRIVTTLLRAAPNIRIPAPVAPVATVASVVSARSTPSRAQLLKRFWRHFSNLHRKFPQLQVGMEELRLVIELLDRQQGWIETRTLWSMLRIVGRHFDERDARLVRVLEAFMRVFEARGEQVSANELKVLIAKLQANKQTKT